MAEEPLLGQISPLGRYFTVMVMMENPDMKAWSIKMSLEPIFMGPLLPKNPRGRLSYTESTGEKI